MSTIFPAAPGTYLVERHTAEKRTQKTPVIGYYHVQGNIAFPICSIGHGGLTKGRALMTPDGFVTDPSVDLVCESLSAWEKIVDSPGYAKMKSRVLEPVAKPEPVIVEEDFDREPEEPESEEPAAATAAPLKSVGRPQVFQTTSFWRVSDEDSIFILDGGDPAPAKKDARFTKIKRDDYQAMKKSGATILAGNPLSQSASGPQDDDLDGSDLV